MKHMPIEHREKLAGLWLHKDNRGRVWAACKVYTGKEVEMALRLGAMGHEAFCPTYKRTIRPVRKRKAYEKISGMHAGYVYLNISTVENLEEIYREPDFHYFVRFGDKWSLIAESMIEAMVAQAARGMFEPSSVKAPLSFKIGDKVRVREGPFGGLRGEVAAIIGGRITVMEGDFTKPVEFPAEQLEADG